MKNCDKGFEGMCCCNCIHQVKIMKHPLNKGEAKGSILDTFGYGCNALGDILFNDRGHGMCEEYESKEPKKHICFEASHIECSCQDKCLRNINNY